MPRYAGFHRGFRPAGRLLAVPALVILTAAGPSATLTLSADAPASVAVSWADGAVDLVVPFGGAEVDLPSGLVLVERRDAPVIPSCDGAIVELSAEVTSKDGVTTSLGSAALVDGSAGLVHCHLG